jgi:SsrA-binding protein
MIDPIKNRKASHEYIIIKKLEVGIILQGSEVKSINERKVSFVDSWVSIENGEMFLNNFTIENYKNTTSFKLNPKRKRKLLAHKSQIDSFANEVKYNQSLTIIPLDIHISNHKYKFEIALCKGKNEYDKRQALKEKESNKDH